MMYKTLCVFRDLQDGHLYDADEPFPHDGRAIDPMRIDALLTGKNAANKPLITVTEELTDTTEETPQKPKKRARTKQ